MVFNLVLVGLLIRLLSTGQLLLLSTKFIVDKTAEYAHSMRLVVLVLSSALIGLHPTHECIIPPWMFLILWRWKKRKPLICQSEPWPQICMEWFLAYFLAEVSIKMRMGTDWRLKNRNLWGLRCFAWLRWAGFTKKLVCDSYIWYLDFNFYSMKLGVTSARKYFIIILATDNFRWRW